MPKTAVMYIHPSLSYWLNLMAAPGCIDRPVETNLSRHLMKKAHLVSEPIGLHLFFCIDELEVMTNGREETLANMISSPKYSVRLRFRKTPLGWAHSIERKLPRKRCRLKKNYVKALAGQSTCRITTAGTTSDDNDLSVL